MTNISDDIRSVSAALGVLVGRVGTEDWSLLLLARANLAALAEQVEGLEQCLIPPPVPEPLPQAPCLVAACTQVASLSASPVGEGCGRLQ